MRLSKFLAPTTRDVPAEAEVISHQLLIRAGFIRRLASGIYNYLPLMWRVLLKVERIVREEMDRTGAQELLMPIMQPADIWQDSGRWEVYGKELIRFKDRHDRDCVLGPTHEEVITTIAKREIQSYRQLPMNLYQIQNKYRDEIRPRFGLLRGREFIMKDAYSFHTSAEDLDREYDVMAEAYRRIFQRCGLDTRMVRSDSGAIGGSVSHEFMVLTHTHSGESDVYYCNSCDYAANGERAESVLPDATTHGESHFPTVQEVETPDCSSIEQLAAFLKCPSSLICKTLLYIQDEQTPVLVMLRGDVEVEEIKLKNALQANEVRLASAEEVFRYTGTEKGYVGPAQWDMTLTETNQLSFTVNGKPLKALADTSLIGLTNMVIAYNKTHWHLTGFNWSHSTAITEAAVDIRQARVGDTCPECFKGQLEMTRGIEVGNIFQLGTKYSEAMQATYSAEDGTEKPFIMGCYGIGISRTAAAAVEGSHDDNGIIWPIPIAPFHVALIPVNTADDTQRTLAETIYHQLLNADVEVLMDDRDERAGVKFKDADLMGLPIRVTVGKKAVDGLVEVKRRDSETAQDMTPAELLEYVHLQLAAAEPRLEAMATSI